MAIILLWDVDALDIIKTVLLLWLVIAWIRLDPTRV